MESLKYITKGMINPTGKQKVFFTSHEDDVYLLEEISKDILTNFDVAIYYKNNEFDINDLKLMQLIVIPISKKFLFDECDARCKYFTFAKEYNIPILPLIIDEGIEFEFNKICGDLQCLNKYSKDKTEISFNDKLKTYLNSIFINDDLKKRINNAFFGNFFLSYRKKDRHLAQNLMKDIHSFENLETYSFWYDEFLVPGEDYSDNIEEEIKNCDYFIMAVTENLLEENNYVLNIEYPLAVKYNKIIIPIKCKETDINELSRLYKDIPNLFTIKDLSDLISKRKSVIIDCNTYYLIALSYLSGINVEPNLSLAIKYLNKAIEDENIEAYIKLASMHFLDTYNIFNVDKGIELIKKAAQISRIKYSKDRSIETFNLMIKALSTWGENLYRLKKYEQAKTPYLIMNAESLVAKKYLDNNIIDSHLATSFINMGDIDFYLQKYTEASNNHKKAYDILANENNINSNLFEIAMLCEKLSKDFNCLGDIQNTRKFLELKVSTLKILMKSNNDFNVKNNFYQGLYELADLFYLEKDYTKAIELLTMSITGYKELYNVSFIKNNDIHLFLNIAPSYLILAKIKSYQGEFKEAKELLNYLNDNYLLIYKNDLSQIDEILSDINMKYGALLVLENNYTEAIIKFKEALKVEKKLLNRKNKNDIYTLIELNRSMAQCLQMANKYDECETYLNHMLLLVKGYIKEETIPNIRCLYYLNSLIANFYLYQKKYDLAENCIKSALGLAYKLNLKDTTINNVIELISSLISAGEFYEKVNDLNNALYYYLDAYKHLTTDFNDLDDIYVLNNIIYISRKLMIYNKDNIDLFNEYIDNAINANEKLLNIINTNNNLLSLGDLYSIKALLDRDNINATLLEKSKEIYLTLLKENNNLELKEKIETIDQLLDLASN